MKRFRYPAGALLVLALTCQAVQAQCGQYGQCGCEQPTIADLYKSGYAANVIWPRQYVPASRRGICQTYAVMINNGWRRQNLLGDYHFESETNELTRAGELKVNWILTQAPPDRRQVFVQRGMDVDQTAQRIEAVNALASNMSPAVEMVDVTDTHIVAEGHPAGAVDNMFIGFQTNQPPPVLPAPQGSNSTSQ